MRQPVPFGKYLLLDRISVGGMAEVFKAKSYGVEGFEKVIAIKRILPSMGEDQDFIKMFIDEAKIAGQLSHANICQIFELGRIDGAHFIAMEYIWGKDLLQIQNRFRKLKNVMGIQMACYVIAKVCEGLHYAHKARDQLGRPLEIVHRDCSPQNVLVSYEGEVKIIDFGIARAASRSSRTNAGVLKGKFGYMSPEQVRGLPLDHRSDIFAVGTILYESLTGQRLFLGESDFSTLEKVRNADVLPPRHLNDNIPAEVERICMKALQRDQRERYQWCAEMHRDLQKYLTSQQKVFTNKSLGDWLKQTGFLKELRREKSLMEQYKKVGRDGLIAGAPAAKARLDVVASLGAAGDAEGDPTVLGGPSFDDIIDDDALPADAGGNGAPKPAEPAEPPKRRGQRMLVVPKGKSLPDLADDDDDDDGDFDDGPTEIFGEIAGDDIDQIRQQLADKVKADADAAARGDSRDSKDGSGPRSGSPINPIVPKPGQPGRAAGSGFPGPGHGPGLQSQVVRSLQPGRPYGAPPPHRAGSVPAPPAGTSPTSPPNSPYPPGPRAGSQPMQGRPHGTAPGQQPRAQTPPPGGQVPLSDSGAPGQHAYPLGSQQGPPLEYPRAPPGAYATANVVSLPPPGTTLPPSRRKPSLGKDIAIGVAIAAIVLGGFAAGKYFLFGDSPGPRAGEAGNAHTGTIALAVGGSGPVTVYVDGEEKGEIETESAQLEVDAGEYELKVVRRGYPPCERKVNIEAKEIEVVSCPFTEPPLQGKLVLAGLKTGQRVFVNDEEISAETARAPIELVPDKDHEIVVRQKDTTVFKETVKLEPGQQLERSIDGSKPPPPGSSGSAGAESAEKKPKAPVMRRLPDAEPEVGYFLSYTTPWARVFIDDKDTGKKTPIGPTQKISLSPGKHKVTFVVGSDKFSYPVTIKVGKDTKLVRDLPVGK